MMPATVAERSGAASGSAAAPRAIRASSSAFGRISFSFIAGALGALAGRMRVRKIVCKLLGLRSQGEYYYSTLKGRNGG